MTTQEAKEILSGYRPGTDDDLDPIFAEALALARKDPSLQAWLDESLAFDAAVRAELACVTAPESVRAAIVLNSTIVRVPWWNRPAGAAQWAAAAALAVLAAVVAVWYAHQPTSFADFQSEIADRSWDIAPHLQAETLDLAEVRRELQAQGLTAEFPLPPKLSESDLRGYSIVEWRGRQIPMLYFDSEGRHLLLFVTPRRIFSDAPEPRPAFHRGVSWPTVSWTNDEFVYVLSGLPTFDFVKKFRKDKRWDWES